MLSSQSFVTEIAIYGVLASLAGATLILLSLLVLLKRDLDRRVRGMNQALRRAEDHSRQALKVVTERIEALQLTPKPESEPQLIAAEPVAAALEPPRNLASYGESYGLEGVSMALAPPAPRKPLPSELRINAIEMYAEGLDASTIAARLSMRENEVRLILKVHNTLRCRVGEPLLAAHGDRAT